MDTDFIISKFGGIRPLARLLDYPVSTVQNWLERKNIPSKQQSLVLKAAIREGIDLKPQDFFDLVPPGNGKKHKRTTGGP